jgi:hypothetical protein
MREDHGHRCGPVWDEPPMASYPPGRKRLSARWWCYDFDPGSTLLAREECRGRRAARPPKHPPDVVAQKAARRYAKWAWACEPAELERICPAHSLARN